MSCTVSMHILICHERYLFRFGADRVLMLIGKALAAIGHRVTMMANRSDRNILSTFAQSTIEVPADLCDYYNLNEWTADWLRNNWNHLFSGSNRPDAVIVGGWPFISAIPVFRQHGASVIFADFGVTPADGYSESHRRILEKLTSLRRQHLPSSSAITGLSDFVINTQTVPDSGGSVPVHRVYCGADHMELDLWTTAQLAQSTNIQAHALDLVRTLKSSGSHVILGLGRWEPNCYKNSQASFDIMRRVSADIPNAKLLVLADANEVQPPSALRDCVVPIGFPDDVELLAIMREVEAGISTSLWEGFNLPLAEMQWLGRPAFVFRVGAHPEVAAHEWYLCDDAAAMAQKLVNTLRGQGLADSVHAAAINKFRQHFTWDRATRAYANLLDEVGRQSTTGSHERQAAVSLFIDVTNATRDPANSGVMRVTRRLGQSLQREVDVLFVVWDTDTSEYVLPTSEELQTLSNFNGPAPNALRISPASDRRVTLDDALSRFGVAQAPWLLITETVMESRFRDIRPYARAKGFRLGAIFYDAIPVLRPDLCNQEMRDNHAAYMRGLAECDLVLPISEYSGDCLRQLWKEWGIHGCAVEPRLLPAEFGGIPRNQSTPASDATPARILCVSTLEPRKNHRGLIDACLRMQDLHPEVDWRLTLVGNRYAGADDLHEYVRSVCRNNHRIQWLGIVDDATLQQLYREATFTVYASVIEGYGMPVMESMWHGRPCICYNRGVMAELATGGGCLTTDVTDVTQFSDALYKLATDGSLRSQLTREAMNRPVKTWADYAREVYDSTQRTLRGSADIARAEPPVAPAHSAWESILYPSCLTENWQMNHSERLAMTALLARHRPHCSIEIGTYRGGSLSLLTQYSPVVFSIDVDPEIPHNLSHLSQVNFLTGDSGIILPVLLQELNAAGLGVDFILIDGDHSASGIRRDLSNVLRYRPLKPLFVALHDSGNPDCRSGMLQANWRLSPYCHWVDLDFVPGRIIEHGGGGDGEMWGGLALAYFLPTERQGDLQVGQSARTMLRAMAAYVHPGR